MILLEKLPGYGLSQVMFTVRRHGPPETHTLLRWLGPPRFSPPRRPAPTWRRRPSDDVLAPKATPAPAVLGRDHVITTRRPLSPERSHWLTSVDHEVQSSPMRVRKVLISAGVQFCASSSSTKAFFH